ncbi:Amidohydrolase 3 [metagenome]|uniref:Amidohydrolase 3 n=1 Tax=metagenome TaxID=256318 RepID=A0A2P2CCL3_9ZZZZ
MITAFVNGSVFDGHRHRPGESLLVEDGVITARGASVDSTGSDRVVDLDGGLVTPGFVDAHVHAVQGGLERIRCDLSDLTTRAQYLARIAEYAARHPELPWILGGGWSMAAFPGNSAPSSDLDALVPDRPVFLVNRDHHGAWVNTRAMELAGVTARTDDPVDGHFDRDADRNPTGTLHEGAMSSVTRFMPATHPDEFYQGFLEGQRYLHSHGITGWQDAILGDYAGIDDPSSTYLRAAESGDLTASVVGALWWDRERGLEQLPELLERRARLSHGRLRATSVKIMQDGIAENGTAAMLTPYFDRCGHSTTNLGHSFVDATALREYVAALDAEGFQVHVHAIGDRGVRETLDAFAALDGRSAAGRHHIAHLQLVHPDDVPRFGALGVAANMQALWACHDDQMVELTLPYLGPERSGWQYPFGDLARTGSPLAMGSDWPVSSPDPLAAIHVAVNRTAYGADGAEGNDPLLPEQALDLATAFAAYTSGSARINHRDAAGTLEVGTMADLAVLDRDPFSGPASEIGASRVVSTWVDGEPVYLS